MSYFSDYTTAVFYRLQSVVATDERGEILEIQGAFDRWCHLTTAAQNGGRSHYFIGNGASATMASHMALDCAKNAGIRALAFNDPASLTALGNDVGFDQCFAQPLRWHARAGDILVAISSSGRSRNILVALEAARTIGCNVVTLTGMGEDNPTRKGGGLNFYIPAKTYGAVECAHQILLHCWLDQHMELEEWG